MRRVWRKKKKVDAILNAKTDEISGNMTVMTIAQEETMFVGRVKFIAC
jgi:hypothetical protein